MGEIIKQKFNLYNTVGFIDKDRNIYFVPHQDDIYDKVTESQTKVCDCYFSLFNEVSPFSSKYHDIEISQWSPEDRVLKIEGLIDDFRQSRGQGLALNYLVMTREIYEVEGETETLKSKYYYAFFIDSVEQVGSRSVKLNLSPDYFTNFFYLNNGDTLTLDYDPFNPVMKNCFIERQHYDRFAKDQYNNIGYTNLRKILGSEETFKFKYQFKDKRMFLPISQGIDDNQYQNFLNSLKAISTKAEFRTFCENTIRVDEIKIKWFAELFVSYLNVIFKENILMAIGYSVTGVSGKTYQKPGYCAYNGVSVPFVHTAIPFISIPKGFENIQKDWFSFSIHLGYKANTISLLTLLTRITGEDVYNTDRILGYLNKIGCNQYVLTTYVSKYSSLINNVYDLNLEDATYSETVSIKYRIKLYIKGGKDLDSLAYVTGVNETLPLSENSFSFLPFYDTEGTYFERKFVGNITPGCYQEQGSGQTMDDSVLFKVNANIVAFNNAEHLFYLQADLDSPSNITYHSIVKSDLMRKFVFVIGTSEFNRSKIYLHDGNQIIPSLDKYIDPLLESAPYCFYSISINETEQIISKSKLIESYSLSLNRFDMEIKPILSYNDSYKIGLIPSYYFNQKYERYYNEAIITIISSQVPVIEDSWLAYYTTNKAQMKNQYAVQYTNYSSGVAQNFGTMPFKALTGFVKQGGAGAVASAVDSVGGLVNDSIANAFQIENIKMSQSAKMADMGAKPDTVKFAGSDILYDMIQNERGYYLNYYRIDEVSYNSACKYLERFGYLVNIFDTINPFNRVGLNYVKITSFDFVEDDFVLSQEQMEAVTTIFENGVTLLHNHDYLHNLGEEGYHNIETYLQEEYIEPQLTAPTISLSDDILTVNEVQDGQFYDVYVDGNVEYTIGSEVTINITESYVGSKTYLRIYDGFDNTGRLVYNSGEYSAESPQVINCTTGYIYIECKSKDTSDGIEVTNRSATGGVTLVAYTGGVSKLNYSRFKVTGNGTINYVLVYDI